MTTMSTKIALSGVNVIKNNLFTILNQTATQKLIYSENKNRATSSEGWTIATT